jgi:signal peptidase I
MLSSKILTFRSPNEYDEGVIKRIIGLPGDYVKAHDDIVEVPPGMFGVCFVYWIVALQPIYLLFSYS